MLSIILVCFTEPSMPTSLMAIGVTYTTMTLSWTEPEMPNGHITSYHLQYRITDNTNLAFHILFPINNATTRTVTRLVPGTNYTLRISAVTIIGRGPYTSIITNRTLSMLWRIYCIFI